jgi:predicted DNA repair protein MutK
VPEEPAAAVDPRQEQAVVSSAIRTDFILSAEIMVIALDEVAAEVFWARAVILVIVALLITALVYGVVGLIVKMDDVGLRLARRESPGLQRVGRLLVKGMPVLLEALSTIGIAAMLWVGGHILVAGSDELGWHGPLGLVHRIEEAGHAVPALGPVLGWLGGTIGSAIFGLVVGAVVVGLRHLVPRRRGGH